MTRRPAALTACLASALIILAACGPPDLVAQQAAPFLAATALPAVNAAATPSPSPGAGRSLIVARSATAPAARGALTAPATPRAAAATPATTTVSIYFTQGSRLVAEPRLVLATNPLQGSVEALLGGPRLAGHFSQVPAGTRLRALALAAGTATLDLTGPVQSVQGSPAVPLLLAQVVETATQFSQVQRVVLRVDGQPLHALGGEGLTIPQPLDRAAVQRLLAGA